MLEQATGSKKKRRSQRLSRWPDTVPALKMSNSSTKIFTIEFYKNIQAADARKSREPEDTKPVTGATSTTLRSMASACLECGVKIEVTLIIRFFASKTPPTTTSGTIRLTNSEIPSRIQPTCFKDRASFQTEAPLTFQRKNSFKLGQTKASGDRCATKRK